MKIVLEARAAAARACRLGVLPDGLANRLALGAVSPIAADSVLLPAVPAASSLAALPPKHLRKIAQVHGFLQEKVPGLPDLKITKYLQPDRKDEREARLRYTLEQGRAIFSLPSWTGCVGERDWLSPGNSIIHDSLFFILLLVWYTGAWREEIRKLRLPDVDEVDGISFLRIDTSDTGRVKNSSSVRHIPVAGELVRLGFLRYVEALRADGKIVLFPEIAPAEGTKRKRGDLQALVDLHQADDPFADPRPSNAFGPALRFRRAEAAGHLPGISQRSARPQGPGRRRGDATRPPPG